MVEKIKQKIIYQLVLAVFTIISILSFSALYYFTVKEANLITERLSDKVQNLFILTEAAYSFPIWNLDKVFIDRYSRTLLNNPEIIAVFVKEEHNTVLSCLVKENFKSESSSIIEIDCNEWDSLKGLNYLTTDIYMKNKIIGSLEMYYTDYFTLSDITKKRKELSLIFISILMINVLLIALLLKQKLVKPLLKLLRFSNEIANTKDFTKRIEVHSKDEIGQLCNGFNNMIERLQHRDLERDKLETQLRKVQSYLNNIIQSMPSMLITIDENGVITQWNQAASENTGIASVDVIGKNVDEVAPFLLEFLVEFKNHKLANKPMYFYRKHLEIKDKGFKNISLYPLTSNGVKGIVLRADDVSELEKKEEQLRQMQKMETIGTLAGGLAHDFNNVLGGIVGVLSLLSFKIKKNKEIKSEELKEYVFEMEQAGNRAIDMVKQLLTLSRKQETDFLPIDLNLNVKHVMKICQNTFDKCIDLDFRFYPKPAYISGDPTQIEQVILNLCVNANHAMTIMKEEYEPKGGKLSVNIEQITADSFFCANHPEAKMIEYYNMCVSDSGVGMDSKTAAKIFDPFFTTKEVGKGTGLGLAMVYNIVKQHNGFIDLYSEKNIGTTISVYLPVFDREGLVVSSKDNELEVFQGKGTVLIVDDEEIMRKLAGQILKIFGFDTIFAHNGYEAIQIYTERLKDIKFVLLDMVMPKMSGKETYIELKKLNSEVIVILTSGFRQDERVESVMNLGVNDFVQKPYTLGSLSNALTKLFKEKNL